MGGNTIKVVLGWMLLQEVRTWQCNSDRGGLHAPGYGLRNSIS